MILIQVQLANASIIALLLAILAIPPAVLGLILGIHDYTDIVSLKIPSCLTASAEIFVALTQFSGLFWPYQLIQIAANCVSILLLAGSGMYYIGIGLQHAIDIDAPHHNTSMEIAFVCLWVLSLIMSTSLTFFSLGATVVAMFGPEEPRYPKDPLEDDDLGDLQSLPDGDRIYLPKKPSFGQSIHSLGSPVDIPTVPAYPAHHPNLSPRLSWPSSVGSLRESGSLGSLRSALDVRNITPPSQFQQQQNHQPLQQQYPQPQASQHSLQHHTKQSNSEVKSPSIKTPKSPLKIHLSRSSFSLKRSPSKASQNNGGRAHQQHKKPSPQASQATMPTIPNADSLPLGVPVGLSMVNDSGTQKNWVMIPNENSAESRSVSGSSQLTGRVFPASEYNRKINAAGFQRDEPVPVQVQMASPRQTLSQYDLERMHRRHRNHS